MSIQTLFFALFMAGIFAVLGVIALTGLSKQTKRALGAL